MVTGQVRLIELLVALSTEPWDENDDILQWYRLGVQLMGSRLRYGHRNAWHL